MDYPQYYQQPPQQPQQQFYGGYQRPMQQVQQAAPGYVCKPVTSREEAVATSTDYFSLGVVMPDFPATDYITAVAVGIVSGLAATGANQIVKQLGKDE